MFLTSNSPSLSETILSKSPLDMGIPCLFSMGSVKACSDFSGYILNFPKEQMLTRMVLGKIGVPKCPDDIEDGCVCVDQKLFWQ